MHTHSKTIICALLGSVPICLSALTVDVERMDVETGLPWGYEDTTGIRAETEEYDPETFEISLSEAPWVDYMVALNSGAAGILAEKAEGAYLDAAQSTVAQLSGGANGGFAAPPSEAPTGTERFALFLNWDDGFPLPSADGWYGVSWGGWDNTAVEEMQVRVDLASEEPVNVIHWFNDGWLYSSDIDGTEGNVHTVLEGHEFTVEHLNADGTLVESVELVLPSGGAGQAIGKSGDPLIRVQDHRQFYTATMTAQRTAPGDYLMLKHRAANIGYRATAVTLGQDRPWQSGSVAFELNPGGWKNDELIGWTYGYTTEWGISLVLGNIFTGLHPTSIFSTDLGWLVSPIGNVDDGIFYYRSSTGWIWTQASLGGWYYDYASGDWAHPSA